MKKQICSVVLFLLEEERTHASHFALFFDEDLKVLVNDCDGEQDTGSGSDCTHEIGENGKGTDAEASEGRGRWNVPVQLVDHGGLAVTTHNHLLLAKLLGNLAKKVKNLLKI